MACWPGWAYGRSKWFKTFLTYLIPAPLIFALFFLLTPPVSGLVFPSSTADVEAAVASDTPVVFVVFDEFPLVSLLNAQGGIDATRYPNFAALASMSTWYKYTAAAHDNTLWAVPSLLTGQIRKAPAYLPRPTIRATSSHSSMRLTTCTSSSPLHISARPRPVAKSLQHHSATVRFGDDRLASGSMQ